MLTRSRSLGRGRRAVMDMESEGTGADAVIPQGEIPSATNSGAVQLRETQNGDVASEGKDLASENWNYVEDLEKLCRILSQSAGPPSEEIGTLREIIEQFIQRNEALLVEAPESVLSNVLKATGLLTDVERNSAANTLTPALVNRTIGQMLEFESQRNLLSDKSAASSSRPRDANSDKTSPAAAAAAFTMSSLPPPGESVNSFTAEFKQVLKAFQDSFSKKWLVSIADPFTNHVILRTIMSYLPAAEVVNCRYVNGCWSMNGALSIRNRHNPVRLNGANLPRVTRTLIQASQATMPYSRFEIELGKFLGSEIIPETCSEFFTKLGYHVRSLKMYERDSNLTSISQTLEQYEALLRIIFNNVPNLESLTLWRPPAQILAQQDFILEGKFLDVAKVLKMKELTLFCPGAELAQANFFCRLFNWMPRLTTLKLIQNSAGKKFVWMRDCNDIRDAISACKKLEELIGDDVFPVGFLASLCKKLKTVRIHVIIENDEHALELQNFLKMSEVKVLQITSGRTNEAKFTMPDKMSLTHLDLCHKKAPTLLQPTCYCAMEPITTKLTPTLKYVAGQLICFETVFPGTQQFETVEELLIKTDALNYHIVSRSRAETFSRAYNTNLTALQSIFPNLKKLSVERIHLNSDCLKTIFSFHNLTELNLYITLFSEIWNINYVLCGYTKGSEAILKQLLARKNFELLQGIDPTGPSLVDLKFLKKLRVEFYKAPFRAPINNFTVHMALLRMRRLQLTLVGNIDITPDAVLKLEKHHENFVLSPVDAS